MNRSLGNLESALALTDEFAPLNLVSAVRIGGTSFSDAIPTALEVLQRHHPLRTVCVVGAGGDYRLEPGAGAIPFRAVDGVGEDWVAEVENELNTRVDRAAGPPARCTLVRGGGESPDHLVLTLHHSIVDGASAGILLHELLSLSNAIESGEPVPTVGAKTRAPLPPADELLPTRYRGPRGSSRRLSTLARQLGEELSLRASSRRFRDPIASTGRCLVQPITIEEDLASQLVQRLRRGRVSVNSFLIASMLILANRHLHRGVPARHRGLTFADLRPYLQPPVPPDRLGCFISMLRFTARVDASLGPWPLAREVHHRIADLARRGDKFTGVLLSKMLIKTALRLRTFRLATAALTYAGPAPVQASYGPIRVLGVYGFVSNNTLGAELAAVAGMFEGQLQCNLLFMDSDLDRSTAARMGEELRDLVAAAPGDPFPR
jgi:hypothetical protein